MTLVISFAYNVLSMLDIVPAISQGSVKNTVLSIVQLLTAAGILVDPTTVGISDSERALTYYTYTEYFGGSIEENEEKLAGFTIVQLHEAIRNHHTSQGDSQ